MDTLAQLSHGAKLVLGAAIAFVIVSFFSWFDYNGPGSELAEAFGGDTGITMWHGVGWLAGLLAIVLVVWQALRIANIELELGVTPAMITAALAILMLIFTFIRFIDAPGVFGRTFWAWLGLALSIAVVVGAWMNMQAAGESVAAIRARVSSMTAGGGASATAPPEPPAPPAPEAPAEPAAPAEPSPPAAPAAGDAPADDGPTGAA
jgi:hypothetical protein